MVIITDTLEKPAVAVFRTERIKFPLQSAKPPSFNYRI
jgi:hypothetical protein